MEEFLSVILIFVVCLVLLMSAYLFTVDRRWMCNSKGTQISKEEKMTKPDTDEPPTITIIIEDYSSVGESEHTYPPKSNPNHLIVKIVPENRDST